jgi:hypothetical protein
MISIHLNSPEVIGTRVESLRSRALREQLTQFYHQAFARRDQPNFYHRCARDYEAIRVGEQTVLTVTLVKPDQVRYWTRSMALHDADAVVADLLLWQQSLPTTAHPEQQVVCG